jgi:hypothetical protein
LEIVKRLSKVLKPKGATMKKALKSLRLAMLTGLLVGASITFLSARVESSQRWHVINELGYYSTNAAGDHEVVLFYVYADYYF